MITKKVNELNDKIDTVVDCPEIDSIWSWDKEQACWENQYYNIDTADEKEKLKYERPIPIEQLNWENWLAKVKDPISGKFFKSGLGSGTCKSTGEIPKRYVTAIIRLKSHTGQEYLLSHNRLVAYNNFGDEVIGSASLPEKYYFTSFKFQSQPNHITGFAMRVNVGPAGGTLMYTLPFNKENASRLFEMRENDDVQLIVKNEPMGKSVSVSKPNGTLEDNFDLFINQTFPYLFNGLYISNEQKLINSRIAEGEGLIPKMDDSDRMAQIKAQESLAQKDKHVAIQ